VAFRKAAAISPPPSTSTRFSRRCRARLPPPDIDPALRIGRHVDHLDALCPQALRAGAGARSVQSSQTGALLAVIASVESGDRRACESSTMRIGE
jgi:hypothetical protein